MFAFNSRLEVPIQPRIGQACRGPRNTKCFVPGESLVPDAGIHRRLLQNLEHIDKRFGVHDRR